MTTTDPLDVGAIREAAVEAAQKAYGESLFARPESDHRAYPVEAMRAALAAAYPVLREDIAAEVLAVAEYEFDVAFRFQDGEQFTIEDLRAGRGLFDDNFEVPLIVARRVGDEDGEFLELGDEFRDEYEQAWLAKRQALSTAKEASK